MPKDLPIRPIFGPSHAVRLRYALSTGQLPELTVPSRVIGVGGMPIWSPRVRKELASSTLDGKAFFIVGDFRFGNRVLNDPAFAPEKRQEKEYLAIEKALINEENDRILFDLCRSEIESLNAELKGQLRLLFWDLSIREAKNRAAGRYQGPGGYRHPVWNLDDVLGQFPGIAIDTREMLEYGEQLCIDNSAHPSLLGWLYIARLLRGDAHVDLAGFIRHFDHSLNRLVDCALAKEPVLITGNSKFTRLLGLSVQMGHFRLPAGWAIRPLSKTLEAEAFGHCLYFPSLSSFMLDETEIPKEVEKIRRIRTKLASKHKKVSIIYYDNWAYESISQRRDYLGKFVSKHPSGLTSNLESATCPEGQAYKISDSFDFDRMLERNATLKPTTIGILEILCRSTSHLSYEQVTEAYNGFVDECYGKGWPASLPLS